MTEPRKDCAPSAPILLAEGVGLARRREGPPQLDGVSLRLDPGELVGLCGPNGSGKTTLLKLLSGRLACSSGTVTLAGRSLAEMPRAQIARLVAVVAQENTLAFPFSAQEVVLMGRATRLRGLFENADDIRAAREACDLTDTTRFASRPYAELSGGEKQRVLLARALAQEPRLLLLDEPAAFLDLRHQLAIYRLLRDLAARRGLAVLSVFHDLNSAARFCHRLVFLSQGRLAAAGTSEEVLTPATIEAIFGLPVTVSREPLSGSLRVEPIITP
ncbi:MAG: ABC transporter ATP-binding protein [Pseudomonadota bacterium]